jgi:ABC-type uncharacterized transport system substrate-binding protein
VERLADGALLALGYDYTSSGPQAARLVDRILKGENPRDIPFERYSRLTVGLNLEVAAQLGLTIPPELLARATQIYPPPAGAAGAPPPQPGPDPTASRPQRLAIFQFSDNQLLMEVRQGILDELRDSGVLEARRIEVTTRSAQGDFTLAQSVAQDLVRQQFDYIVTITSPALQLTARFNKTIPHVFGDVTDPFHLGVADSPERHQENLTGIGTLDPVDSAVKAMRQVFPKAKRIGMAWNPSEPASQVNILMARAAARQYQFELLEATVAAPTELRDAVQSLLHKGVDLFFTSGDITVDQSLEAVARLVGRARVPLVTTSCEDIKRGAIMAVGPDYYDVGRETGRLAVRVIKGEPTKDIPITNYGPEDLVINQELAKEYGVTWPEEILQKAANPKRRP